MSMYILIVSVFAVFCWIGSVQNKKWVMVGEVVLGLEWPTRYQSFINWLINETLYLWVTYRYICVITLVCIDSRDRTSYHLLTPHNSDCRVVVTHSEMTIKLISDEHCFWQINNTCVTSSVNIVIFSSFFFLLSHILTPNFSNFYDHFLFYQTL